VGRKPPNDHAPAPSIGEIGGKKVLRIVGQCQELSPTAVEQLRNTLGR
jgi:hypothetical protein